MLPDKRQQILHIVSEDVDPALILIMLPDIECTLSFESRKPGSRIFELIQYRIEYGFEIGALRIQCPSFRSKKSQQRTDCTRTHTRQGRPQREVHPLRLRGRLQRGRNLRANYLSDRRHT